MTGCARLIHLWEMAVGICAPSALLRDFPAVSLPAFQRAILTFWAIGRRRVCPAACA